MRVTDWTNLRNLPGQSLMPTIRLTKADAIRLFRDEYPLMHQCSDHVARRCAWNDWVDHLNKSGLVTDSQADRWLNPYN